MEEVKFITSNIHKVEEVRDAFSGLDIRINHLKMQYSELQADSIKKVVLASASELATTINEKFLIEDSGLSVDALMGFPGPYSSYIFRTVGWRGILRLMEGIENRNANFQSIFAFFDGNQILTFEGKVTGIISNQGLGSMGFGFDPIFIPNSTLNTKKQTYAELPISIKNKMSHRGKSLELLKEYFNKNE